MGIKKKKLKELKKRNKRIKKVVEEVKADFSLPTPTGELNYEDLIQGKCAGRTGTEFYIQKLTLKDPGLVLAFIGLDHPASPVVLKYLADEKYKQLEKCPGYLTACLRDRGHQVQLNI